MSSNFRISMYRNSGNLHMKLVGDFDGTSAWELLNLMKETRKGIKKVIIDTSGLKNVHPFGLRTFQLNLCHLNGSPVQMIFKGRYARVIAPDKVFVSVDSQDRLIE